MNQVNKSLIHAGPYILDESTTNVVCVRGEGQAIIAKCAPGIYNRKGTIQISYKQAKIHASIMSEALQVFALTGRTPMELYLALSKSTQ